MKKLVEKIQELIVWCCNNTVIRYLFFGGCASAVNLLTYYGLRLFFDMDVNIANSISVCASILFGYYTKSKFVFESQASGLVEKLVEFVKYLGARVVSVAIEMLGVWLMVDTLLINDYIAKFIIQFVVLVVNYVLNKFLIFTKK
ncbi:MAG: GtrA family protein [Roseburia sp.]|nr:GtrA family protein [Roseburia sp.]